MPLALSSSLALPPWRLSGTVVGAWLNDPVQLAALGEAVNAAPYKAPPRAPVLYFKPRNTQAGSGAVTRLPAGVPKLCVGATLGIVIHRPACRVRAADAAQHIAGYALVADLFVPHASHYRPHARQRALDASCLIGAVIAPRAAVQNPDALNLAVQINNEAPTIHSTAGLLRGVATLLQDVSEFMTLHAGDVLLLGVRAHAPLAGAGDRYTLRCAGLGELSGELRGEVQA